MGFPLPCLITRMYMGEKTWNNEKLCSIMKNSPLHLLQSCMTPFAANAQPGPIFQSVTTALQHVEAAGHTPLPPLQCCKPPGQDTKYQAETEPSAIVNSPGMPWAECAKFQKNLSSTMFKQWAFDDHFFYNIYIYIYIYIILYPRNCFFQAQSSFTASYREPGRVQLWHNNWGQKKQTMASHL